MVTINNSVLKINSEEIEFNHPIEEYISFDDFVVIRLKLNGEDFPEKHQNVIAVNKDGSIRWRIEKAPEEGYYDSYAGIFDDDGELRAYNLSGMNYKVDKETGEVSDGKFVK
ncbi:hypothetical protein ACFQJ7_01570 [Halovenus rubra]|uniref:Uncharacterized protein n=2 Tax=Halovenus rubra TaxID=869890 RepID=A0ABD5X1D5_9EURY|nr:hypothetical protein [Halovenus rubra]